MFANAKLTDVSALLGAIDAVSTATTVTTGWVPVADFHEFCFIVDAGVFGSSATVDAKIQQALDSSGTTPKDVTGKAITQLLAAGGNNRQAFINLRPEDLDTNNAYCFIRGSITVGTAASLVAGILLGYAPRLMPTVDAGANPAVNLGASTVAQIV
jgi:hypothetical protein